MTIYRILICIFIPKLIFAQINGEFWWLNSELQKLKKTHLPSPKFEALSEFDNDESAKIIFREELIPHGKVPNTKTEGKDNNKDTNIKNNDFETANVTWPNNLNSNVDITKLVPDDELMELENTSTKQGQRPTNEDLFVFKFPDDKSEYATENPKVMQGIPEKKESGATEDMMTMETKFNVTNDPRKTNKDIIVFKFSDNYNNKQSHENHVEHEKYRKNNSVLSGMENNESENICTYMKKNHCFENNGIIYELKKPKMNPPNHLICCILPPPRERESRIIFPDSNDNKLKRRLKRSSGTKSSLNQRDFIFKQRFREPSNPISSNTKIVTPDDEYVDPYWNIKNHNSKTPTTQSIKKHDCNYQDYVDDYVVELPRPGLVGLYSDQGAKPPGGWTYQSDYGKPSYDSVEDEDDDTSVFGYSTVDPRRVSTSNIPKRRRPIKITTTEPEVDNSYDVESQTVNFQSNPNFQVLQGFKLLNFGRDKNKLFTKNPRGTTETSIEDDEEAVKTESDGGQVYENCGKFEAIINARNSKQIGEAEVGSHPWLAVVVLTKRPQNILCYATIVHPRAAITVGDCVGSYAKSTSSNEVILVAGLRDSKDRTQTQNRFVTIQLHPQHRRDTLNHNLALLHWQRSLRLNSHVQPACLTQPNGDCKFFGWGGFDQAMRQRPQWQRASIISVQDCEKRFTKAIKLPKDAFCATVQARGTVTGIGGSLICTSNGRASIAGIAVYRDTALVLIPAQEWIIRAMEDLNIE